ncbi:hypothetical protein TNCV_2102551 [Trichonephila clavipes]|nr:hypothetical protein TNCV_2102551 [Trichonephila clavipes]
MLSACDQSTLPIDVQVFHCKSRDPHVEAWRVGCHLSCPPCHSTEVPNHTVYERRVRYTLFRSTHSKKNQRQKRSTHNICFAVNDISDWLLHFHTAFLLTHSITGGTRSLKAKIFA